MADAFLYHTIFDGLAVIFALLGGWLTYRWRYRTDLPAMTAKLGAGYFVFLSIGSLAGAYVFGTLNLLISGIPAVGRSLLGALAGAILMVELYKQRRGAKGSTGFIYVVPFAVIVIIGRIGCFLSGIHDQTHGVETGVPWAWDYGDGVMRHPVQIYESLSMLAFLVFTIALLRYRGDIVVRYGFYLCAGFYALQRFVWEFFKPYADVIGPLNLFQILCIAILLYSGFMISRGRHVGRSA